MPRARRRAAGRRAGRGALRMRGVSWQGFGSACCFLGGGLR
jgi:hypothetical protein